MDRRLDARPSGPTPSSTVFFVLSALGSVLLAIGVYVLARPDASGLGSGFASGMVSLVLIGFAFALQALSVFGLARRSWENPAHGSRPS